MLMKSKVKQYCPTKPVSRGFTLLEVLVSLAIITIVMAALLQSLSVLTRNESSLYSKKLVTWVAQNKLHEIQLNQDSTVPGNTSGTSDMAGQSVAWEADISSTSDPLLMKIAVTTELNQVSQTLYGYVASQIPKTQ